MQIKNLHQYANFLKNYDLTLNDYIFARNVKQYDDEGNILPSTFDIERFNMIKELNSKNHKEMTARYKMRKRIVARVCEYELPYFVTITFDDDALNRDYERNIKEMMKRYNISKWCFITDYGSENQRLHYHGYVDLKDVDMSLFSVANSKKYKNGLNFNPMTKNFGFNLFTPIEREEIEKTTAYTVKYATKSLEGLKFEHKMFCSRCSREEILQKKEKELERQNELLDLLFS